MDIMSKLFRSNPLSHLLSPDDIRKLRMRCKHKTMYIVDEGPYEVITDYHNNLRCELCGIYVDHIISKLRYSRMICKHKKPDNSTAFIDQNGELRCEICGVYKDEKGRIYIYEEDED